MINWNNKLFSVFYSVIGVISFVLSSQYMLLILIKVIVTDLVVLRNVSFKSSTVQKYFHICNFYYLNPLATTFTYYYITF